MAKASLPLVKPGDISSDDSEDDLEDYDDPEWIEQKRLMKDPLFLSILKKYLRLYDGMLRAKPVLVQEKVGGDPWKLLVAVLFLNKTAGKTALPVFWAVMKKYPTPKALSMANVDVLREMVRHLGLQDMRAKRLIKLSRMYLEDPPDPTHLRPSKGYIDCVRDPFTGDEPPPMKERYPPTCISHLPGTGQYALDSYRIFSAGGDEWKSVIPADKELIRYLRWKWAYYERMKWSSAYGVTGPITELDVYMEQLCIYELGPDALPPIDN